jgi:hypothetical protein
MAGNQLVARQIMGHSRRGGSTMGANERLRHEGGSLAKQCKVGDAMAEATVPRTNLLLGPIVSMVFLERRNTAGYPNTT